MAPESGQERRKFPRIPVVVAVELRHDTATTTPMRVTTSEMSLGGCYIETMFTLPVGTKLEIVFWIEDQRIAANGMVATCFPQVGNGITVLEIAPEDQAKLESFLKAHEV
jgi:hypothetical protein